MAEYVCKVADATGKIFQQVESAQNEADARQKLADRGFYVYSVHSQMGVFSPAGGFRRRRSVSGPDFLIFNQQFNTLVRAGLPILKALDLLAERAASDRLKPFLDEARRRVREGAGLSDAFESAGVFPKVYTTALLAGEKSGNLTGVLEDYIAYQRVTTGVRKKLIGVLIYPCILLVVGICIMSYLVTSVIPKFAALYKDLNVPLPGPTQLLISLVVTYRFWMLALMAVVLFGIVATFLWSRTEAGGVALDRLKLRLPLVGDTWIKFQMAQFSRTLATLLAGGTPLVTALVTSADSIGSQLIARSVADAANHVREGESLSASLAGTRLMPSLALEMIEVGEASGALAPMLNSVAQFYDEETGLRMQALLAVIEPAILVVMALMVAFILIALYLPLFSVSVGTTAG